MNTPSGVFVNEYTQYQEWLMGFVSGFNDAHANDVEQQVRKIDLAGMDLWMRNWCNQRPTKAVWQIDAYAWKYIQPHGLVRRPSGGAAQSGEVIVAGARATRKHYARFRAAGW
jgi:hypothetical protein